MGVRKKGLGRGLSAMINDNNLIENISTINEISIETISRILNNYIICSNSKPMVPISPDNSWTPTTER